MTAVASAVAVTNCHVYDDSLRDAVQHGSGGAAGAAGASSGGGSGASATPPFWTRIRDDGCPSAGLPTADMRPPGTDDGDTSVIYLAIDKLRLGSQDIKGNPDPNAWEDIGFDLDGVCTDPGSLGTPMPTDTCSMVEELPCTATTSKNAADGHGCRDNTFGRFEVDVSKLTEVSKYRLNDDQFNCALCVGYFSFVIKITGYNGQPNDPKIRLDLYPSPGLQKPAKLDCMGQSWKLGDLCWVDSPDNRWKIDPDAFAGPVSGTELPDAKISDGNAYVRDGYVIAQLPDPSLLWFPTQPGVPVNSFPIIVHKGVVAAKISKPGGRWELKEGTIEGATREMEMVNAFRQIGFCEADSLYGLMTSQVHAALDILASGPNQTSVKCDSMSVGVGFNARQATPGPPEKVVPLVECMDRFATGTGGAAGASGSAGQAGVGGGSGHAGNGGAGG